MRNDNTPIRNSDISEIEQQLFNMEGNNNDQNLFLCGIRRANISIGNYIMHTLLQRNHNKIANIILLNNKYNLDDENIFQLAKTINICQLLKFILGPYITAISGNFVNIKSDYLSRNLFNHKKLLSSWEYNLVYQFHLLLPEHIGLYKHSDIAYNTELIYSKNIAEWINIACKTQCYEQKINNCQDYLLNVEKVAIEVSRKINLLSYCDYRKKLQMSVPNTFEELTGEKIMSKKLENVYKDIKNLDFYVGINSEPTIGFFGETTSKILGIVAWPELSYYIHKCKEYVINIDKSFLYMIDDFKYENDLIYGNLETNEKLNKPFSFYV